MERLIRTGKVRTYSSAEITHSRIGIGFEKLDRGMFDPEKAYDQVAATGAKWVRIQSGWARTEQEKGVYSFEWLDRIVDVPPRKVQHATISEWKPAWPREAHYRKCRKIRKK